MSGDQTEVTGEYTENHLVLILRCILTVCERDKECKQTDYCAL